MDEFGSFISLKENRAFTTPSERRGQTPSRCGTVRLVFALEL
jgi:hypothetical protein